MSLFLYVQRHIDGGFGADRQGRHALTTARAVTFGAVKAACAAHDADRRLGKDGHRTLLKRAGIFVALYVTVDPSFRAML